jgi:hypothetical protein
MGMKSEKILNLQSKFLKDKDRPQRTWLFTDCTAGVFCTWWAGQAGYFGKELTRLVPLHLDVTGRAGAAAQTICEKFVDSNCSLAHTAVFRLLLDLSPTASIYRLHESRLFRQPFICLSLHQGYNGVGRAEILICRQPLAISSLLTGFVTRHPWFSPALMFLTSFFVEQGSGGLFSSVISFPAPPLPFVANLQLEGLSQHPFP